MDIIRLSAKKVEDFDPNTTVGEEVVNIYINGQDIREIIHEVELPFATSLGKPEDAGNYELLAPVHVFFPNKHFLGDPEYCILTNGKVPILRCVCGEIDCNPIYVRITVQNDTVIWSDFENPWHTLEWTKDPWDYSSLRFVFDRNQYESQLNRT
jgi:hypothetical protein